MADAKKTLEIILQARDEASKTLQKFGGQLKGMSTQAKIGAGILAGLGATTLALSKSFVETSAQFEKFEVTFGAMLDDMDAGTRLFKDLTEFAVSTPFSIEGVAESSQRLLAFGTSAEDLIPTLTALGDISAGVGTEKMPQLVRAFGQIQSKGRLMGQELLQLTETGIPIIEELAEVTGFSAQEIATNTADLGISFEQVRQALFNLSEEGGQFHNLMQVQSETTAGQINALNESFQILKASLGDALIPAVTTLVEALIPLVQGFAEFAAAHPQLIAGLTAIALFLGAIGAAALALGPVIAGAGAVIAFFGTVIQTVIAIIGVLVAILGGPVTIVIGIVIAAVTLLAVAWKKNWLGIRDATKKVVDWFMAHVLPLIRKFFDFVVKRVMAFVNQWVGAFNRAKDAVQGLINKIGELINKAKEIGGKVAGVLGFQHGGVVPGGAGDAVPAILHGGERVIPRTGTDVNDSGGGRGGTVVNITIEGDVSSMEMLETMVDTVKGALGRDNELATKGVAI